MQYEQEKRESNNKQKLAALQNNNTGSIAAMANRKEYKPERV
ncbi:hypothetical protein ACT7C7_00600 [Bacillus cereus]